VVPSVLTNSRPSSISAEKPSSRTLRDEGKIGRVHISCKSFIPLSTYLLILDGGDAILFYKIDIFGVKHVIESSTSKNACISVEDSIIKMSDFLIGYGILSLDPGQGR
jgi:hypothetical protein